MANPEAPHAVMRTDTATLAVFDPARLQHRLNDAADWWSVPSEEVTEINRGNVLFVSTSVDGDYLVYVHQEPPPPNVIPVAVQAVLVCNSGSFYIGAGEYVPSGGLQPHTKYGGMFCPMPPGNYRVSVVHLAAYCLDVFLEPVSDAAANAFDDSPQLPWPSDQD